MKYCTSCVMPSTRPGITFDSNGVCAACQSFEKRKEVDYKKRWQELEVLCDKYRGSNGPNGYDCMIAVSGGKDSHFHDLTHEWQRTHHVEQFDQIESPGYLVHPWMKYPKFGHASATDYAARMVRYGRLTREEAIELVRKHDHDLDPRTVREFCSFAGYSEQEFWKIIENHYNTDLFEKQNNGCWVLKNPVWSVQR